jgi:hypothetical protein
MAGDVAALPPAPAWFAVILCLGGLYLLLEGFRSFPNPAAFALRFVFPLTISIGIAVVLLLLEHSARYLLFPYPLDDGEGFCLNQAVRVALGLPLYPPLGPPPYIVTNYPPFSPLILGLLTDPESFRFATGRMVSVLSTVVLCIAAAGCVHAATGDRRAAWIAALMVAAGPVVYFWGALLRVDVLASALGLVGLWIAMRARGLRVLWSLPFLLAALYTRQSSIEAALAIILGLLMNTAPDERNHPRGLPGALAFGVLWTAGAAAVLLLMQFLTGGEFWLHTVVYTRTQFYPERILSAADWILPSHALMFLIALFALPRAFSEPRRRMLAWFFIMSFGTSMLSGKVGSDLNYFLNLAVASACLCGCFAADCFTAVRDSPLRPTWILVALMLIPAGLAQSGLLEGDRGFSFTPRSEDYQAGFRIVDTLSRVNGPILSEDEGFCLLSGHQVVFNPFIMSELAREGLWDQSPFVHAIEDKVFDLIMLRFDVDDPSHDDRPGAGGHAGWDRFTPEMERAISENYEIDTDISPIFMRRWWFIYRPRPEPDESEEEAADVGLADPGG